MEKLAERWSHGLAAAIKRHKAPWHVVRVGARVEFICAPGPLKNGAEAAHAHQPQVEAALHTALLNRGSLIAPFHNMMLISPKTRKRQVDRLIAAFDEVLTEGGIAAEPPAVEAEVTVVSGGRSAHGTGAAAPGEAMR